MMASAMMKETSNVGTISDLAPTLTLGLKDDMWKLEAKGAESDVKKGGGGSNIMFIRGESQSQAVNESATAENPDEIDISDDDESWTPKDELFESKSSLKMMLQFKTPFWLDKKNNRGGFDITDSQGFLTSSEVVAQLRYPRRSKEPGNIVMVFVVYENAEAFAHKINNQGYIKPSWPIYEQRHQGSVRHGVRAASRSAS